MTDLVPLTSEQQRACEGCVPWAKRLAREFWRRRGMSDDFDDVWAEAEDALVQAARKHDPSRSSLTNYSHTAIARALAAWGRKRAIERRRVRRLGHDLAGPESTAAAPLASALDDLLALADPLDAEALRLSALAGLSYREVGRTQGVPWREARRRADRAVRHLRRLAGVGVRDHVQEG